MSEVQGTERYMYPSVPKGIKVQIGTTPFRVYLLYLPQTLPDPHPLKWAGTPLAVNGGPQLQPAFQNLDDEEKAI